MNSNMRLAISNIATISTGILNVCSQMKIIFELVCSKLKHVLDNITNNIKKETRI